MQSRRFVVWAMVLTLCVLGLGTALAAGKTYKYRCPKCQLIEEYAQPGIRKCPKDGTTMIKAN